MKKLSIQPFFKVWRYIARRLLFIFVVFVIPVAGAGLVKSARIRSEIHILTEFHRALPQRVRGAKETPATLCNDQEIASKLQDSCQSFRAFTLLSKLPSISYDLAIWFLLLTFGAAFFGLWSKSRLLLLVVFLSGMYLAVTNLILWNAINAAILIGLVVYTVPSRFRYYLGPLSK